ncbi:hypothetical protein M0802_012414 [Mischocyttarus mexicanus]|nr:hypothetical protein M0802_012414 [Mischocyttarus mexicanus]
MGVSSTNNIVFGILGSLDLQHTIDPIEKPNYAINEATKQKHVFQVRDILINRTKRYEINLISIMIRQRLYCMQYAPHKETAAQFQDCFEKLIRNCDAISDVKPFLDEEKRDTLYNAILRVTL